MVPRPFGEIVHVEVCEVFLHFDYLSLEDNDKINISDLVDGVYDHLLVLEDELSRYVRL